MGWCTAQSKKLLFVQKQSCKQFELASLNKKKKEKHFGFWSSVDFLVWYIHNVVFFEPLGVLFIMKTLEDEWYIVIKYKLSILEILRVCFVVYCMSVLSLHIESNQLCDKSHCTFM